MWNLYDLVISGHRGDYRFDRKMAIKLKQFNKKKPVVAYHAIIWKFTEYEEKDRHDNMILITQLLID